MDLVCRRCHRRVGVGAAEYDIFEQMHFVCFHYEFEHGEFDVDEPCGLAGCPSAPTGAGKQDVIATARSLALAAACGEPWENTMLHEYLEALAAWLEDSGGYYTNRDGHGSPSRSGWYVINDALRAATVYE